MKTENPLQHGIRIIRQEGVVRFFHLILQAMTSKIVLSLHMARFYLTKPGGARVVKIDDAEYTEDVLPEPGGAPVAEGRPITLPGHLLGSQDRVQAGLYWYDQVLPERASLIQRGHELFSQRKVLFILPVTGAGGGSNSVFLAVEAMQKMGVDARIMNLEAYRASFRRSYPDVTVPVFFGEVQEIPVLAAEYDAVIATSNDTVAWVAPLAGKHPHPVIGYYIQDYEAYFYPPQSAGYRHAAESYTLIPDQVRCVTTQWIHDQIYNHHRLDCHIIGGHINTDLFRPRPLTSLAATPGTIRIVAMIRPVSERRSPRMTMEILQQASRKFGKRVECFIFGCQPSDPGFARLPRDFPWRLAGELRPAQIANLLNQADIFVDYSVFQALGLAALEAMACGLATIVPGNGGTGTFARPGENCLVVDTSDRQACYQMLERLIEDDDLRRKLQSNAIPTAVRYYAELPAFNLLKAMFP